MRARIGLALVAITLTAPLVPSVASADTTVVIGTGVPVYPVYRRHHHSSPVVVYGAPPPVVVYGAPPPAVVYQPAPGAGISAAPASPTYTARNGQTCREYQTTVLVGGIQQAAHGTACLQPDGSWRTVN